jgi:hypothetical protein
MRFFRKFFDLRRLFAESAQLQKSAEFYHASREKYDTFFVAAIGQTNA